MQTSADDVEQAEGQAKLPFLFKTAIQVANLWRRVANPSVDRSVRRLTIAAVDQPNASVPEPSKRQRGNMTMSP